jgi:2-keto-3-deoxy-L-rhamnonate aldolase RhmA
MVRYCHTKLDRRSNIFPRERLPAERLVGTFIKLPATESVEIAAQAGFDFVIVDLEHSQLSDADGLRLVRHAFTMGFPAVARVPECDRGQVNRLLEAGASGIQLSTVTSAGQVRELVAATRYAPGGERSVSLAHPVAGYGATSLRDAVKAEPPLLVGQIETAETADPLDKILAAGLDVVFIGTTDLTVAFGFDQARVGARVQQIAAAAEAAGVTLGTFAATAAAARPDARYLALASDLSLLREVASRAVADAR